jgi:hypothetical protein
MKQITEAEVALSAAEKKISTALADFNNAYNDDNITYNLAVRIKKEYDDITTKMPDYLNLKNAAEQNKNLIRFSSKALQSTKTTAISTVDKINNLFTRIENTRERLRYMAMPRKLDAGEKALFLDLMLIGQISNKQLYFPSPPLPRPTEYKGGNVMSYVKDMFRKYPWASENLNNWNEKTPITPEKMSKTYSWINKDQYNGFFTRPLFKNQDKKDFQYLENILNFLLKNPYIQSEFVNALEQNKPIKDIIDSVREAVKKVFDGFAKADNLVSKTNISIATNCLSFLRMLLDPLIARYIMEKIRLKSKQGGGSTDSESYETLSKEVTEKLRNSLERSKADLSQCEKEREVHEEEIKTLTQKITTLQADIRKSMLDLATTLETNLDESKEAPTDNTEQYKTLITETQKRLAESDTTLKEARQKLEGLKAETPSIDKKIQDLQGLIKDIEEVIATLNPSPKQQGGSVQTHPLLELAAAISSATASLAPK